MARALNSVHHFSEIKRSDVLNSLDTKRVLPGESFLTSAPTNE